MCTSGRVLCVSAWMGCVVCRCVDVRDRPEMLAGFKDGNPAGVARMLAKRKQNLMLPLLLLKC